MCRSPHPRNPAELLGLGHDPALCRLLRACGVEEACITGGASDYDKFLALAETMPLCEGHPARDGVNEALAAATGLEVPLCPHTARLHWDAWVETDLYGGTAAAAAFPAVCPDCVRAELRALRMDALTVLPSPGAVKAPDLAAWSVALESAFSGDGRFALFTLPSEYVFIRPDPYHAGLAVKKVFDGGTLAKTEEDLLTAQALRVWGLMRPARPLVLKGGSPAVVTALLDYLEASKALPPLLWIPDVPADAGEISGRYASVGTGFVHQGEHSAAAYAAVAPLGCATVVV